MIYRIIANKIKEKAPICKIQIKGKSILKVFSDNCGFFFGTIPKHDSGRVS